MKRFMPALVVLATVSAFAGSVPVPSDSTGAAATRPVATAYGKLPLAFEPNLGQAGSSVKFLSHAGGSIVSLTSTETALLLRGAGSTASALGGRSPSTPSGLLSMTFLGANPSARVVGADPLPGVSNYFIGSDPSLWRTGVPHYGKVVYRDLYPGIDLTFHGNQSGHLEYDFTVRPGADPSAIRLGIEGTSALALGPSGDLAMGLGDQTLTQRRPHLFQTANGISQPVAGGYILDGNRVGFEVGSFDESRPLVIDPEVVYSTYLGGSTGGDLGETYPAADDKGHVYICGATDSTDFPVTPGAYQSEPGGDLDAFVTKMKADGTGLVYSTYLGGTGDEDGSTCAIDRRGRLFDGGFTLSPDFPTTRRAFDRTYGGEGECGAFDGFVAKLSRNGRRLLYSTYIGGSQGDLLNKIQVDRRGHVFAVGDTASLDFPTTSGAFQPANAGGRPTICAHTPYPADHYVLKLNRAGSRLVYSTYLGGPGDECCQPGLAIDGLGNAYVVGTTASHGFPTTRGAFQRHFAGGPEDLAVSKLDPTGSRLLYSTYLGGSDDDFGSGIVVDAAGNAYLAGPTASMDFPVTPGAFQTQFGGGGSDAFVTKLDPRGRSLIFSTYLGGSGDEAANPLIDGQGHVFTAYGTSSPNFPVTTDAFQDTLGGLGDAYVTELTSDGSGLVFSTYWGGSGVDIAEGSVLDGDGNFYATGCTQSADFPVTTGAFQTTLQGGGELGFGCAGPGPTDAFVTKIAFGES